MQRVKCAACGDVFWSAAIWAGHRLRCDGPITLPRTCIPLDPEIPFDKLLTEKDSAEFHELGVMVKGD